jgi:dihydroorotase
MTDRLDLLIRGGTVLDPGAGLNQRLDVGISGGRIAALEPDLSSDGAGRVLDAAGCYVTPGLIDLHTHIYWGVNEFGMDIDPVCLKTGVTTAVDAGSAGAVNFPGLVRYVIQPATTRMLAFVHVALHGVQKRPPTELRDITYADPERAAETVRQYPEVAVGVKLRMSSQIVGENGHEALRRAMRAATLANSRLMVHIGGSPISLEEILDVLRSGDIVTHCFTGNPPCVVDEQGKVKAAVWRARERGVLFDVGHGNGSCSFEVVRRALEQGLQPDVISTDLHRFSVEAPVVDLPTTLSKFLVLGMSLDDVVQASTAAPARAIGRQDRLGRLALGREADLAVLALQNGRFTFEDAERQSLEGDRHLQARWTIRAGQPYPGTAGSA